MTEATDRTSLGDRMKEYERACRTVLSRRLPVILRVDGKAFHTLTRGMKRPFDDDFAATMEIAALALCKEVQGAQLAYLQSDEISVLLHNYKRLTTEAWFDNQVQKMTSVAASVAAVAVSRELGMVAHFDARVFVLPEAEVCNYFLWRQQDATRNSMQMLARSLFSHKQCDHLNGSELQEMCFQAGHNWNDLPTWQRRGRCALHSPLRECGWYIDAEPPVFSADRSYIEQYLAVDSKEPTWAKS